MNLHELCYQCFKHVPDCLFGKLGIKDFNDEPHFPQKIELISSQIQMNTLYKNNDEIKRRRFDKSIHKAMRIPVYIHQTNKTFAVTVQQKHACGLEFVDSLCIIFLDQPQSDIVVFVIITFQIYNILVTKRKRVRGTNYVITFNEKL